MDLELTGKRAIVTGGSRGIGLAIARTLAAEGADVALVARDKSALETARESVAAQSGRTVLAVSADTGDDQSVRDMVAQVVAAFGGVDILVNAAARPNTGAAVGLDAFSDAEFGEQVNIKVLGYLRCVRAVVPHMRAAGWGRVINVSGLAARYTGSITGTVRNVAVAALTKNLADELGRDGINVTVVHPGMTVTERLPGLVAARAASDGVSEDEVERRLAAGVSIGRLVTAEEVASVVAFLASPKSVAVNGDTIAVGGGALGPVYY
ncbi:MAG TPA: SDR family oxidoreductase [Trebonia sp.]|jgi:NAD(P)-dependent dehydrogenase (short-subunit alcohol dehydrogenase family)|nr:SDR family oxidoreductase [Trebonia sp.]